MRIVSSSFIALALVFGLAQATVTTARADQDDTVKGEVNKKATQAKGKTGDAKAKAGDAKAKAGDAKSKAGDAGEDAKANAGAREDTAKAKADARKAEQEERMKAAKAARKARLLEQENKRHEAQLKELEARRARIENVYKRQMSNVELAAEREKARHEKRIETIDAI